MNRYNHLVNSESLRNQLSHEDFDIAKKEYTGIVKDIITFFEDEEPLSNRKFKKLEKALRSNYYWAYREFAFGENVSFKKLCESIGAVDDYDAFSRSSNRVIAIIFLNTH